MKDRVMFDIGQILDEIFEATQDFGNAFKGGFGFGPHGKSWPFGWDENVDYYPNHMFPPANVFMKPDKTMVFEFAMAGYEGSSINLQFVGDYMVLSAKAPDDSEKQEDIKYFKRRLKLKDVHDQKYYVPADKFDQENVKAVYRNGLLKVSVPSRETVQSKEGVKIEIVEEEDA